MADPLADLFKDKNLHTLKSFGYHMLSNAREKGEDTGKPLIFVGLVTMAIGATMCMKGMNQGRGR